MRLPFDVQEESANPRDTEFRKKYAPLYLPRPIHILAFLGILWLSFTIRLGAVRIYGRVIHEFDPWFNMRAAEYLVDNGLDAFNNWFDKESWYPLGRPVGASIFPGLQYTAAVIYYSLQHLGLDVSINDVCVFIPAVFGVLATVLLYLLSVEITNSHNAALAAAFVFSVLPAHLMRSVAGGFDNESIALAAMIGTFYLWLRSIRTCSSWPLGALTGLAYFYMVMAWGGYIFVLNMIGVHALLLLLLGRFSLNLHAAYSLFFVIGTYGAIQLPIVGNLPFSSLEQIGPLGVFFIMQVMLFLHLFKQVMSERAFRTFQFAVGAAVILGASVVLSYLMSTGYLGSFTSRIRSLFIPHTKTGNPLVDSVAEHQATHPAYYIRYLHMALYFALPGFYFLCKDYETQMTNGKLFGSLFAAASFYFSNKMVRLMLLLSPAISYLAGITVVVAMDWAKEQLTDLTEGETEEPNPATTESTNTASFTTTPTATSPSKEAAPLKPVAKVATSKPMTAPKPAFVPKGHAPRAMLETQKSTPQTPVPVQQPRKSRKPNAQDDSKSRLAAYLLLAFMFATGLQYLNYCFEIAQYMSEPQIIMRGKGDNGESTIIDDFREAYWWLRDNTAQDARVMAWWDYGYQISGIARRTTLADGNTWNHEHIALIGKCLVSNETVSYEITKYLADYVLIWTTRFAGMGADDIAKMPHMGNIAGSVFPEVPRQGYYMEKDGKPSPLMKQSLLYQLTFYRIQNKEPEPQFFKEAYTTSNNMVRIYKVKDSETFRQPWTGKYPAEVKVGQFKPNEM